MRRIPAVLILGLVALLAQFGCSDNPSTPAGTSADTQIQGEIGAGDFEISVNAVSGSGRSLEGRFVVRGSNVHYVDSLSALVADLTVLNQSRASFPEPVTLTFVDLIPDSVTVQNPDNGINGDGAAINFLFADDDGMWTPGEESLPRTVQFGVPSGVSIGFVARLSVGEGQSAGLGTIGGMVWNDANENGAMDEGEAGIAGARIFLSSFSAASPAALTGRGRGDGHHGDGDGDDDDDEGEDGDNDGNTIGARTVRTGEDGRYAFERVPAGAYIVTKGPSRAMTPTTPVRIYVILTETNGEVADFLSANFGCIPTPMPEPNRR